MTFRIITFIIIPFYDRSIVKDPYGLRDYIWEETKKHKTKMSDIIVTPRHDINIVRGTFTIGRDQIEKFKSCLRREFKSHVQQFLFSYFIPFLMRRIGLNFWAWVIFSFSLFFGKTT
ncbi:hypothetical protein H5410_049875 [Solanum commersonii]|uniref:Uncharacterized protein n=1 Tax=Solanum commersonii TaxID=4109 RepID=A0A9J5WW93_SOLCO|nr:hypothetical protein H5410_049875 [Solanum commersonii]